MHILAVISLLLPVHLCKAAGGDPVPSSGCTLKSPLPPGVVCGVTGSAASGYGHDGRRRGYISPQRVTGLTECRDLCLRRVDSPQGCSSFKFNSNSSLCILSPSAVTKVKEDPTSNVVHYNRTCFDCPPRCPQQTGVSLFDNGGFDMSARFITPWSGEHYYPSQHVLQKHGSDNSSRAFRCKHSECELGQYFTSCPDTIYELSFDHRAEPGSKAAFYMQLEFYSGTDSTILSFIQQVPRTQTATNWTTSSMLVDLNAYPDGSLSDIAAFSTYIDGHPKSEVDNFKLIPTSLTRNPAPGAMNVLPNGDFESGSLRPWKLTFDNFHNSAARLVSPGLGTSQYAVKWTPRDVDVFLQLAQSFSMTDTPITPGNRYVLTFDYDTSNYTLFTLNAELELTTATDRHAHKHLDSFDQYLYTNKQALNGTIGIPFIGQQNALSLVLRLTTGDFFTTGKDYHILLDNVFVRELAS